MSNIRYCVKCFDNDTERISLVIDADSLFEVVEYYSKQFKVKAFLLSDESEDR